MPKEINKKLLMRIKVLVDDRLSGYATDIDSLHAREKALHRSKGGSWRNAKRPFEVAALASALAVFALSGLAAMIVALVAAASGTVGAFRLSQHAKNVRSVNEQTLDLDLQERVELALRKDLDMLKSSANSIGMSNEQALEMISRAIYDHILLDKTVMATTVS